MALGPPLSQKPEAHKLSAADSSQSSAAYDCLRLFSMKYCLSPGPFQKAFEQLLVQ